MATTYEYSNNPATPENPHIEPIPGRKTDVQDGGLGEPKLSANGPGIHRPPGLPKTSILGPYYGFVTTEGNRWIGSALILWPKEHRDPKLSFDHEASTSCDVLYQDVFGLKAARWNLAFDIPDGLGDEKIGWTVDGQEDKRDGAFWIAKLQQKIRLATFSCNGFDETVPTGIAKDLGFDNVWKHLFSIHKDTPLHYCVFGGDQVYIDMIFKDVPFLARWLKMDWDLRWSHEFSAEASKVCAEYYFKTYCENWEREETRGCLHSCPGLQQWDDHDIFDGAGSYPDEQRNSPVMKGLMQTAQKFRLLFQMHTTIDQCRKHRYFGVQGQNFLAQLGPRIAFLGTDGRTERDHNQVHDPKTEDMWFEKLAGLPSTTQHLLILFAVPFSFIRARAAEKAFEFLKNHPAIRKLPIIKSGNSIFGLPEFYDDLLDEWCHESHIEERNRVLKRLQDFAEERSIRVTLVSGDVHCAAMSRFRSDKQVRRSQKLTPETDPRLMYQVISSAIVNVAPSPNACIAYHYMKNDWTPINGTEESLIKMFERRPEKGKHVRHKKVMPNRNWCYIEEVGPIDPSGGDSTVPPSQYRDAAQDRQEHPDHEHHRFHLPGWHHDKDHAHLDWFKDHYPFEKKGSYPSTLGPTSDPDGTGCTGRPVHVHKHGPFCHHKSSKAVDGKKESVVRNTISLRGNDSTSTESGLRLRLWLESRVKETTGRQFSAYDVLVPRLSANKMANGH